jgi:hypothetical protein
MSLSHSLSILPWMENDQIQGHSESITAGDRLSFTEKSDTQTLDDRIVIEKKQVILV